MGYRDTKINTIIIEDNIESQKYLEDLLKKNFNTISILGFSSNIKDSVALIESKKPELIFMDIELIDGHCFDIFNRITYSDFEVIFVTAFDDYIKKAIDHYAFSYIIKPYAEDELVDKVTHYLQLRERLYSKNKFQQFSNFIANNNSKLLLHLGKEHILVALESILKIEANGNYAYVYLSNGEKHLVSHSLKHYESLLANKRFFKANRSVLINLDHIQSIYKKETIVLSNNDHVHVSVRNKPQLHELIKLLS